MMDGRNGCLCPPTDAHSQQHDRNHELFATENGSTAKLIRFPGPNAEAHAQAETKRKRNPRTEKGPRQWRSAGTSKAIERLHEEFKRRIKMHCTAVGGRGRLVVPGVTCSGQSNMCKPMVGKSSPQNPSIPL
jgi:hypothetical protein